MVIDMNKNVPFIPMYIYFHLFYCNVILLIIIGGISEEYSTLAFNGSKPITTLWSVIYFIHFLSHVLIVTGGNQGYYSSNVRPFHSLQQPVHPHQLGVPPFSMMYNLPCQSQHTIHIQPSQSQQTQGHFILSDISRTNMTCPNFDGNIPHPVSIVNTVADINLMTAAAATNTPVFSSLFPLQSTLSQTVSVSSFKCSSGQQSSLYFTSISGPSTLQVQIINCMIVCIPNNQCYVFTATSVV